MGDHQGTPRSLLARELPNLVKGIPLAGGWGRRWMMMTITILMALTRPSPRTWEVTRQQQHLSALRLRLQHIISMGHQQSNQGNYSRGGWLNTGTWGRQLRREAFAACS